MLILYKFRILPILKKYIDGHQTQQNLPNKNQIAGNDCSNTTIFQQY